MKDLIDKLDLSESITEQLDLFDQITRAATEEAQVCATLAAASNIWAANEVQAEADSIRANADDARLFARSASTQIDPKQRELFLDLVAQSVQSINKSFYRIVHELPYKQPQLFYA